jgi:hypothetical protein
MRGIICTLTLSTPLLHPPFMDRGLLFCTAAYAQRTLACGSMSTLSCEACPRAAGEGLQWPNFPGGYITAKLRVALG